MFTPPSLSRETVRNGRNERNCRKRFGSRFDGGEEQREGKHRRSDHENTHALSNPITIPVFPRFIEIVFSATTLRLPNKSAKLLICRVVSMGRCNTISKSISQSLKG
jgi:hypothetical protein